MEKSKKLDLLKRTLGLKHKLKVHESTKAPETHEETARMLVSKWDFEDEITAIESILQEARTESIRSKREQILKELAAGGTISKNKDEHHEETDDSRGSRDE
jgi:adenylate cyclase